MSTSWVWGAAAGAIAIAVLLQCLAPAAQLPFTLALIAGAAVAARRGTRRLRAQEEEAERLRLVARSARDIIWTWDVDRARLTYVSPAVEKILGVTQEEQLARASFASLLTRDGNERTALVTARALKEGLDEARYEAEHLGRDGKPVWLEVNLAFVRDAGGRPHQIVGVSRDISERKRLEGSLARSAETLGRAQHMEALGQLTGGLAHDFNNLLTVILGGLDLTREALAAGSEAHAYLNDATAAAERGAALTHQLLAFARRQPLRPNAVDLRTLVASMSQMLSRTLGAQIRLEVVHGAGLWDCEADPSQVENAILNLALNARDAMPRGGTLTIETANTQIDDDYAARELEVRPGRYVMLAVSDQGEGMTPEVAARAFEPFFSTKTGSGGSGLGLSMVYGFAKQSGGHVKIYSEPDRGTTVKIYLPRATRTGQAPQLVASDAVDAWRANGELVLVVDDDSAVRHLTLVMLAYLGCRAIPASNAEAALGALEQHPDVQLLLTDVVLPGGMDGFDLADRARKRRPDLRVLLTSGYTENGTLGERLAPDAPFLPKPFRRADLARRIRALLDAPGSRP